MRVNKKYFVIVLCALIPFFIASKWNQPKVCSAGSSRGGAAVADKKADYTSGDEIFFSFAQEEPVVYNSTTTRQVSSEMMKKSVQSTCSNLRPLPTKFAQLSKKERDIFMKHVIVNDQYKFLYCYTPKVACSNWKKVMKVLYGLIENTDVVKKMDHSSGFKKLSDYTEEEVEFRLENYYKFMFVRSPSERVVSAYRNKFNEIEAFYKVYGKRIMDKFHPERSNVSYPGKVPGDDVAFVDFVKYLAEGEKLLDMNEHWMPMYLICQPCLMGYDFIGSTENIDEDSETVLRSIKAPKDVHFPKRQKFYKPTSKSLEHFYFSLVPTQLVKQYTQRYKLDYEMFLYNKPHFVQGNIKLT